MASPRKGGGKPKAAKSAKKIKKPTPARARHVAAKPSSATRKPVTVAKRPAVAPPKSKKAAPPAKTVGKSAVPVKGAVGKRGAGAPVAEVRPLGVLPPSAVARAAARPAVTPPPPVRRPAAPNPSPTAGQGVQRVGEKDVQEFEKRLLEERRKILKEMGHLENTVLKINQRDSAGDLSGYSFHMADVGTDAMEREKAFLFASAEGRTLLEINEALRRLYRGEYGVCESCGQPIARARLEAMPHARLCLTCKEKEERSQRGAM
jgi:RNA polymerase-binding protein DksA